MSRALVILAIAVLSGRLFAQVSPTTPEAAQVRITEGPRIELAKEYLTIISWTTNNPVDPRCITESCAMVPIHIT
jgi:hypothetical protein